MITKFNLYEKLNHSIDSFFVESVLNKKPKFLYHLTSGEDFRKIEKDGLKVEYSKQHQFVQGIYLSNSIYISATYRYDKEDSKIIEIPFNNLNEKYMKPDDWELFQMVNDDWDDLKEYFGIENGKDVMSDRDNQIIWENLDYRHSLYICEQIIYTRNISPDLFSKVYDMETDLDPNKPNYGIY